jgi:hypothetical protein
MPEQSPAPWDPAAPTYQLVPRDDQTGINAARAIEALVKQGVSPDCATAVVKQTIDKGSALVQVIGADWRTMFSELDAAGIRASIWMTY